MVLTTDDTRLPIEQIGDAVITTHVNSELVKVHDVLHVSGMKKILLLVLQLTAPGNYVVFRPENGRVYRDLKMQGTSIMEGSKKNSIYDMSTEMTCLDKASKIDTAGSRHARLGIVNYHRLQEIMN